MPRSTSVSVAGIIEVDVDIDLTPFIAAAHSLVEEIAVESEHDEDRLALIEDWLSAHFYAMRDPRFVSEKAAVVGATYQSKVDLNLATSHYGQMAMVLDTSGLLRRLSRGRQVVSVHWGGTVLENDRSM